MQKYDNMSDDNELTSTAILSRNHRKKNNWETLEKFACDPGKVDKA